MFFHDPTRCVVVAISLAIVSIFASAKNTFADELPDAIRVATWNLEWFFDDFKADNREKLAKEQSAPSPDEWEWKLQQVAAVIAKLDPTIMALQEVENRDVVYKLVGKLKQQHQQEYRYCFIAGYDFGTEQNVAFIYKDGLVEYSRREQTAEMFASQKYYNLSKHLIARFQWGQGEQRQKLDVLNLHLRAAPEQEDQRKRQGRLAHEWMRESIRNGENILIMGDFNTEHPVGTPDPNTDIGIVRGLENDDPQDDLQDLNEFLPLELRATHLTGKEYDRILASPALMSDDPAKADFVFSRIITRKDLVVIGQQDQDHVGVFYSIPQNERDISDHYPVMVEFLVK